MSASQPLPRKDTKTITLHLKDSCGHVGFHLQPGQRYICLRHGALESGNIPLPNMDMYVKIFGLTYNFNVYLLLIPNKENHISVFFVLLDFFVRSFTYVRHCDSRSLEAQTALLRSEFSWQWKLILQSFGMWHFVVSQAGANFSD
jgi:hypothetical protein